ncbi:MAG: hypothetical protein KDC03_12165, partial [Flavobacteriales bacterium]|nr:hypothetical protein [Flavobacteriales bacterium]
PLEPGNTVLGVTAIGMDGRRIPLSWNGELVELGGLTPGTYVLERRFGKGLIERARMNVVR